MWGPSVTSGLVFLQVKINSAHHIAHVINQCYSHCFDKKAIFFLAGQCMSTTAAAAATQMLFVLDIMKQNVLLTHMTLCIDKYLNLNFE